MAYPRTVARKAAPNATAGNNQLEIIPAAKYLKANDIVGMDAVVSENVNGYPYVGFTNKAGVRENIYFSKASAKYFADGTPLNTPEEQLEFLRAISFAEVMSGENRDQKRIKMFLGKETMDITGILAELLG